MHVLMLGTLVSDETKEKYLSSGIPPAPADIAQKYLITGLCAHPQIKAVSAICAPRISAFPNVDLKKVWDEQWMLGDCDVETVGFRNYPLINLLHRHSRIVHAAKKWAQFHRQDKVLILLYSMHTPFLSAAKEIKKMIPDATVAMVVADLPQYMSKGNVIRNFLKKVDYRRMQSLLPIVDKYILYTRHMAHYLELEDDQWMVMEGLFDASKIPEGQTKKFDERICIYAGSLSTQYAIDKLMEAFEQSSVNAKLCVYGDPGGGQLLQERYPHFKKAQYCGLLSPEKMFETMKKATLLINPRPSTLELAKYSCPSKTFEYMASGTPVLMTKLPGLPEEYYPYLYFFETEDIPGFIRTLEQVLAFDDETLQAKGKAASDFIRGNKSCSIQVSRIVEFVIR